VIAEWWSQVSATALHGLQITAVGMLLVFFTLGLIILAMVLLTRLPWLRPKEERKEGLSASPAMAESSPGATLPVVQEANVVRGAADDELVQVAAIAVAMVRSHQESFAVQGATRRRPPIRATGSGWRVHGRAKQLGL
jgi:Na+-transporting methylmalonyl-CoA/oxaloacetate decarboxylase gamma subunit